MDTLPDGWAEFNDAYAVIRGHMVAGSGTFSGTFASDNVNAVQEINLKDGCVSSWYHFTVSDKTDFTFVVPGSPWAMFHEIIIPAELCYITDPAGHGGGNKRRVAAAEMYRDGELWLSGETYSTFMDRQFDNSMCGWNYDFESAIEPSYVRTVALAEPDKDTIYRFKSLIQYSSGRKSWRVGGENWYCRTNSYSWQNLARIGSGVHVAVWKS